MKKFSIGRFIVFGSVALMLFVIKSGAGVVSGFLSGIPFVGKFISPVFSVVASFCGYLFYLVAFIVVLMLVVPILRSIISRIKSSKGKRYSGGEAACTEQPPIVQVVNNGQPEQKVYTRRSDSF